MRPPRMAGGYQPPRKIWVRGPGGLGYGIWVHILVGEDITLSSAMTLGINWFEIEGQSLVLKSHNFLLESEKHVLAVFLVYNFWLPKRWGVGTESTEAVDLKCQLMSAEPLSNTLLDSSAEPKQWAMSNSSPEIHQINKCKMSGDATGLIWTSPEGSLSDLNRKP